MRKLPIGIQSIRKILEKNSYLYVDKTKFIKFLLDEGTPHFFISRPRRFGKSLFLNTLEEVFLGNKELFKGLYLYNSDYLWEKHIVLYFDFGLIPCRNAVELEDGLKAEIQRMAEIHGCTINGPSFQIYRSRFF